jgi:hypothetical protein
MNGGMIPLNGNYYAADGTIKNLDGNAVPPPGVQNGTLPMNGCFLDSEGVARDFGDILASVSALRNSAGGVEQSLTIEVDATRPQYQITGSDKVGVMLVGDLPTPPGTNGSYVLRVTDGVLSWASST